MLELRHIYLYAKGHYKVTEADENVMELSKFAKEASDKRKVEMVKRYMIERTENENNNCRI